MCDVNFADVPQCESIWPFVFLSLNSRIFCARVGKFNKSIFNGRLGIVEVVVFVLGKETMPL